MSAKFLNPLSNTSPLTLRHLSLYHALLDPVESALSGLLPLDKYGKPHSGVKWTSISFTMGIFGGGKCGTNNSIRSLTNTDYPANV
jgi:hypothetical protein